MQNADTKLAINRRMNHWRAGCLESLHVRFGRGRMEKDAAGCPSLPSHYGLTNPGTSRTSPAAYLTTKRRTIKERNAIRLGGGRGPGGVRVGFRRDSSDNCRIVKEMSPPRKPGFRTEILGLRARKYRQGSVRCPSTDGRGQPRPYGVPARSPRPMRMRRMPTRPRCLGRALVAGLSDDPITTAARCQVAAFGADGLSLDADLRASPGGVAHAETGRDRSS